MNIYEWEDSPFKNTEKVKLQQPVFDKPISDALIEGREMIRKYSKPPIDFSDMKILTEEEANNFFGVMNNHNSGYWSVSAREYGNKEELPPTIKASTPIY